MAISFEPRNLNFIYTNKAKNLLYAETPRGNAINHGKTCEQKGRARFELTTGKTVKPCGLFLHPDIKFLGASPDGVVEDEDAIVEIKCPYFEIKRKRMSTKSQISQQSGSTQNSQAQGQLMLPPDSFIDAVESRTHLKEHLEFCNNRLELKHSSMWYAQVQGQLQCTQKMKCYLIVYLEINGNFKDLLVREIYRDDNYWQKRALPKLIDFYHGCILPELIVRRGNNAVEEYNKDWVISSETMRLYSSEFLSTITPSSFNWSQGTARRKRPLNISSSESDSQ